MNVPLMFSTAAIVLLIFEGFRDWMEARREREYQPSFSLIWFYLALATVFLVIDFDLKEGS